MLSRGPLAALGTGQRRTLGSHAFAGRCPRVSAAAGAQARMCHPHAFLTPQPGASAPSSSALSPPPLRRQQHSRRHGQVLQPPRVTNTAKEMFSGAGIDLADWEENLDMDAEYQVPNPELGPLGSRVGRFYLEGLTNNEVDYEETAYWFSTPPEGWKREPEKVNKAEEVEVTFPEPYHEDANTEAGEPRITFENLKEGDVYTGLITDVWLYHGAQIDIGAEFDGLIHISEEEWKESGQLPPGELKALEAIAMEEGKDAIREVIRLALVEVHARVAILDREEVEAEAAAAREEEEEEEEAAGGEEGSSGSSSSSASAGGGGEDAQEASSSGREEEEEGGEGWEDEEAEEEEHEWTAEDEEDLLAERAAEIKQLRAEEEAEQRAVAFPEAPTGEWTTVGGDYMSLEDMALGRRVGLNFTLLRRQCEDAFIAAIEPRRPYTAFEAFLPGDEVEVRVHAVRQPGLYRWPLQLSVVRKDIQAMISQPEAYVPSIDHAWAMEQGWGIEDICAATGRTYEPTTYFLPRDDDETTDTIQRAYGWENEDTGHYQQNPLEERWLESNHETIQDAAGALSR